MNETKHEAYDFLRARLRETEIAVAGQRARPAVGALTDTLRNVLNLAEAWPILVSTPPKIEKSTSDPHSVTYHLTQQLEFVTRNAYQQAFGGEAPLAPFVITWLEQYRDHPDFKEEWLNASHEE